MNKKRLILFIVLFVALSLLLKSSESAPNDEGCCISPDADSFTICSYTTEESCCGTDADCINNDFYMDPAYTTSEDCQAAFLDCEYQYPSCCKATCEDVSYPLECSDPTSLEPYVSCTFLAECQPGCCCALNTGTGERSGAFYNSYSECYDAFYQDYDQITLTEAQTDCQNYCLNIAYTSSISGTVTDADTLLPIEGASVSGGGKQTLTDENGYYELNEVASGSYSVSATYENYKTNSEPVTVPDGGTETVDIKLTKSDTGTINGKVTDANSGVGIPATIDLSGPSFKRIDTFSDGTYHIFNVPVGTYTMTAMASGYDTASRSDVVVNTASTTTENFALTPTDVGNLQGYVRDDSGNPIQGATVLVNGMSNATDSNGYYLIEDIAVGTYEATASKLSHTRDSANVNIIQGATTDQDFTLIPVSTCSEDGTPYGQCSQLTLGAFCDASGTFHENYCFGPDQDPTTLSDNCPCPTGQECTDTGECRETTGTECQGDCTYATDGICHADCDGQAECAFYNTTMRDLCNGKPKNDQYYYTFNTTHVYTCCYGEPKIAEDCTNSIDDDSDGDVDCDDIECFGKECDLSDSSYTCQWDGTCTFEPTRCYSTCDLNTYLPCSCGAAIANETHPYCCNIDGGVVFADQQSCEAAGCEQSSECEAAGGTCCAYGCAASDTGGKFYLSYSCDGYFCCDTCVPIAPHCCESQTECSDPWVGDSQCQSDFGFYEYACNTNCTTVPPCKENEQISTNSGDYCYCGPTLVDVTAQSTEYCCYDYSNYYVQSDECSLPVKVFGYVTDVDTGDPITGEPVFIQGGSFLGPTDTSGYYEGYLTAGTYTLYVAATGYERNEQTVSLVSADVEQNFELVPVPNSCIWPDDDYAAVELNADHIQGVKAAELFWRTTNCPEEAIYYLYKDGSFLTALNSSQKSYIDYDVEWENSYQYTIKIGYYDGNVFWMSEEPDTSASIDMGDDICEGKFSYDDQFCIGTERTRCTAVNIPDTIMDCATEYPYGAAKCAGPDSLGTTSCKVDSVCPDTTSINPFGLFFTSSACMGSNNYCYMDSTHTIVDSCYDCDATSSCYDYTSQSACEIDNCVNCNSTGCLWEPQYPDLGIGFCYQVNYTGTDYCGVCNPNNGVFKNTGCSQDICGKLGACHSDGDSCTACRSTPSCYDYENKEACTGGTNFEADTCTPEFTFSEDACGIGLCRWNEGTGTCLKDGNSDHLDDCDGDIICEISNELPEVGVIGAGNVVGSAGADLSFVSTNSITFRGVHYCISNISSCCDFNYLSAGDVYSTSLDFDPVQLLGSEYNGTEVYYLRYYALSTHYNIGETKTIPIFIDADAPTLDVYYNIIESEEVSDVEFTITASEVVNCTDSMVGRATGSTHSVIDNQIDDTVFEFTYTDVVDDYYDFDITCTDSAGNEVHHHEPILIDSVQEIIKVIPPETQLMNLTDFDFVVETLDLATCWLYFEGTNLGEMDSDDGTTHTFSNLPSFNPNQPYLDYSVSCENTLTGDTYEKTLPFVIDLLAPETSMVIDGERYSQDFFGVISNHEIEATFECEDPDIPGTTTKYGCDRTFYCISGGPSFCTPDTVGNNFTLDYNSGVCFYSTDKGNNIGKTICGAISIDTVPPVVVIDSPSDGLVTHQEIATVSGYVTEDNLDTITLQHQYYDAWGDLQIEGQTISTLFNEQVSLHPGKNHIKVIATDLAQNTAEDSVTVYYDTQGPTFMNLTGRTSEGEFEHEGCDGIELTNEYGRDMRLNVGVSDINWTAMTTQSNTLSLIIEGPTNPTRTSSTRELVWSYLFDEAEYCVRDDNCEFLPGAYTFTFDAADIYNNPSSCEVSLNVEDTTAPDITITIYDGDTPVTTLTNGIQYTVTIESTEPIYINTMNFTYNDIDHTGYVVNLLPGGSYYSEWTGEFMIDPFPQTDTNATFVLEAFDRGANAPANIFGTAQFHIDTIGPNIELIPYFDATKNDELYWEVYPEHLSYHDGVYYTRLENLYISGTSDEPDSLIHYEINSAENTQQLQPNPGLITGYQQLSRASAAGTFDVYVWGDSFTDEFASNNHIGFEKHKRRAYGHYMHYYPISSSVVDLSSTRVTLSEPLESYLALDPQDPEAANAYLGRFPTGIFGEYVPLQEGQNFLNMYATDIYENRGTNLLAYEIVKDTTVPKLLTEKPSDRTATANNELPISVVIEDDLAAPIDPESAKLIVSTSRTSKLFNHSDLTEIKDLSTSTISKFNFSFYPSSDGWPDRKYYVNFTVKDYARNYVSYNWSFTIGSNVPILEFGVVDAVEHSQNNYAYWFTEKTTPQLWINFSGWVTVDLINLRLLYEGDFGGDDVVISEQCSRQNPVSFICTLPKPYTDNTYTVEVDSQKAVEGAKPGHDEGYFVIDTQAPIFTLYTDKRYYNSSQSLLLTADVTNEDYGLTGDVSVIDHQEQNRYLGDFISQDASTYTFLWERVIGFPDSEYTLHGTLTDVLGHSTTQTTTFIIDNSVPIIEITDVRSTDLSKLTVFQAPDYAITGDTTVRIYFDITETNFVSVSVEGAETVSIQGSYVEVNLEPGDNNITLIAVDEAGNIGRAYITILLDNQGPYFANFFPQPGTLTGDEYQAMTVDIWDPSGINESSIEFWYQGVDCDEYGTLTKTQLTPLIYSVTCEPSQSLLTDIELNFSEVFATVMAEDNQKNINETEWQFDLDIRIPTITSIIIRDNENEHELQVEQSERVSINTRPEFLLEFDKPSSSTARLIETTSGREITLTGGGNLYQAAENLVDETAYTLTVTATASETEISATYIYYFIVDVTEPTISLDWPGSGDYTTSAIDMLFTAYDDSGQMTCDLYIDSSLHTQDIIAEDSTQVSVSVSGLGHSLHTWRVECRDSSNPPNTAATLVQPFNVDTQPPSLEIITPKTGAKTPLTEVTIEGIAIDEDSGMASASGNVFLGSGDTATNTTFSNPALITECDSYDPLPGMEIPLDSTEDKCDYSAIQIGNYVKIDGILDKEYIVTYVSGGRVTLNRFVDISDDTQLSFYSDHVPGYSTLALELADGDNTIKVSALDNAGNSVEEDITIEVDENMVLGINLTWPNHPPELPVVTYYDFEPTQSFTIVVSTDMAADCTITHLGDNVARSFTEYMDTGDNLEHYFTLDQDSCLSSGGQYCWVMGDGSRLYHYYTIDCDVIDMPLSGTADIMFVTYNTLAYETGEPVCTETDQLSCVSGDVEGTILDLLSGDPIPGAIVSIGTSSVEATDGTYLLTNIPAGIQTITASADGYTTNTTTVTVGTGEITNKDISLAPKATLSGTIDNTFGELIEGATITVNSESTQSILDGSYYMENVDSGYQTIYITAPHHMDFSQEVYIPPGSDHVFDAELIPLGSISGDVTDISGTALADVLIYLEGTTHSTSSDGNGVFELVDIEPGNYDLVADRLGYFPQTIPVTVNAGQETNIGTIQLEEKERGSISGYVYDGVDGTGILNARVTLEEGQAPITEYFTGDTGAYSFAEVYEGEQAVTVSRTGYVTQTQTVVVEPYSDSALNFNLMPYGSVEGIVYITGIAEYSNVILTATCGTPILNTNDGTYTISQAEVGVCEVTAEKPDYITYTNNGQVEPAQTTTINLLLQPESGIIDDGGWT